MITFCLSSCKILLWRYDVISLCEYWSNWKCQTVLHWTHMFRIASWSYCVISHTTAISWEMMSIFAGFRMPTSAIILSAQFQYVYWYWILKYLFSFLSVGVYGVCMCKQQVHSCLWHPESGSRSPRPGVTMKCDPLEMNAENPNWVLQTSRHYYNCWSISPVLNLDSLMRHCWEHFPIMICIYNFKKKKKLMSNCLKNVCASCSWISGYFKLVLFLTDLIKALTFMFSELFLLLTSWISCM